MCPPPRSGSPVAGQRKRIDRALVEIPWREGRDEQTFQRDALLRLQGLVHAEIERLDERSGAVKSP